MYPCAFQAANKTTGAASVHAQNANRTVSGGLIITHFKSPFTIGPSGSTLAPATTEGFILFGMHVSKLRQFLDLLSIWTTALSSEMLTEPLLAVGGLGGSGTRVVGQILQELGFYLGPELNPQLDNILFTLLFKRRDWFASFPDDAEIERSIETFVATMHHGGETILARLSIAQRAHLFEQTRGLGVNRKRFNQILSSAAPDLGRHSAIAWKEPNTHIFLPQLTRTLPNLKYMHVMRHGLDMALSGNRQQLINWGAQFDLGDAATDDSPNIQLEYWLKVNHRALDIGRVMGPDRFLLVNYDRLCRDFDTEVRHIEEFLGLSLTASGRAELSTGIHSTSAGRHLDVPADTFSPEERQAVAELGFEVAS